VVVNRYYARGVGLVLTVAPGEVGRSSHRSALVRVERF
jgi:hypothetical protein